MGVGDRIRIGGRLKKLKLVWVNVNQLVPLPGNPRIEVDNKQTEKLMALIKSHGFQNPLQVFPHKWRGKKKGPAFMILCGNHRFEAGKELGMKDFPCIVYDGTKKMAMARALSDNKSQLWTDWDVPTLKDMIVGLDDGAFDITLTGFDKQELHGLFAGGDFEPGGEGDQGKLDKKEPVECPECGHEFGP